MIILDWFKSKPKSDRERLKELEDAFEAAKALDLHDDVKYITFEIIYLKSRMGLKDKKK